MTERPILFSGEMVRAILDDRKTQTRRVVKDCRAFAEWNVTPGDAYDCIVADDRGGAAFLVAGDHGYTNFVPCPYGKPGDRLWVREAWAEFPAIHPPSHEHHMPAGAGYRTDIDRCGQVPVAGVFRTWDRHDVRRRPSIHMPRWASRITLEVSGVRVERLQDISEDDARAEGVDPYVMGHGPITAAELQAEPGYREPAMYRQGFEFLWNQINGKRAAWSSNPWVWVVEFRRIG